MSANSQHETVLLSEAVNALIVDEQGFYIDATFGRGGHSSQILRRLGTRGSLLAIDKDPQAVQVAAQLQKTDDRFEIVHAAFSKIGEITAETHGPGTVSGILFDLGVFLLALLVGPSAARDPLWWTRVPGRIFVGLLFFDRGRVR